VLEARPGTGDKGQGDGSKCTSLAESGTSSVEVESVHPLPKRRGLFPCVPISPFPCPLPCPLKDLPFVGRPQSKDDRRSSSMISAKLAGKISTER